VQVGITTIGILTGMFGGDAIGAAIGVWIAKHLPAVGKYAEITIGTVRWR
jgi:putative hemolysin